MKLYDQHVHSEYSRDSDETLSNYLEFISKNGYSSFVITDHYDIDFMNRPDSNFYIFDINKQFKELDELKNKYRNIKILKGIELGYREDLVDNISNIIRNYDFDLVNLSVHHRKGIHYYEIFKFINKEYFRTIIRYYFEDVCKCLDDISDFDVLCHFDYGFRCAYCIDNSIKLQEFEQELKEIFKRVILKDKCLEINTKVQESLPIEFTIYTLNLYKSLGGKNLSLSADSHSIERYASSFEKYINVIKKIGFDSLCYFEKRKRYKIKI